MSNQAGEALNALIDFYKVRGEGGTYFHYNGCCQSINAFAHVFNVLSLVIDILERTGEMSKDGLVFLERGGA